MTGTKWVFYSKISFRTPLTLRITSQFLWFNKDIKVDGKCIYSRGFSKNELNFVGQLFDLGGKLKNWRTIKNEYHLLKFKSFQWGQLVDALKTP